MSKIIKTIGVGMNILKKILSFFGLLEFCREQRINYNVKRWSSHDDKMKTFYHQFIASGSLCFDIGANRGNRTKIFLALDSNVVCFEPQPHCSVFLKKHFGEHPKFKIEEIALGEQEGQGKLFISEADTLSTLSQEWKEKQDESGRFSGIGWKNEISVPIKTLDQMILKHGTPHFAKIDVEGFELNVLKGLNHSIPFLSIEFTPEFINQIIQCIELIKNKFGAKFNFSAFEQMNLEFDQWISDQDMVNFLEKYRHDREYFGDVYIKTGS